MSRENLVQRVTRGVDPFAKFRENRRPFDLQGWGSQHAYFREGVEQVRPDVAVEIGVWKGGSVATIAQAMKDYEINGLVIAVDTFLGAWDHWISEEYYPLLGVEGGRATLYETFMSNMLELKLEDYVLPLPLDSTNAAETLRRFGISIDLLHIDAGHDYNAVLNDLRQWWPLLRPGGLLIGDDYDPGWSEVMRAFDAFFAEMDIHQLEYTTNKCRIIKAA